MLSPEQIDTIHRLHWGEKWSLRKLARHLHLARKTIRKYLDAPAAAPVRRQRITKVDPFKAAIGELLAQDATASAVVIAQRLQPIGYHGGITILRNYVKTVRPNVAAPRAFVRMVWNPHRASVSRSTGGTSARWTTKVTNASSMPSPWWSATAGSNIWSSPIAKASRLSSAATSCLSIDGRRGTRVVVR
ncbi:MAG: hypothetical protein LAQ69_40120 [Acidobacteriia bacterium]|nr:hypothetical protein [Terriglobia bacterium]